MSDTVTEKRSKVRPKSVAKEPPMYQVILLNDHYTSMDFVVFILQSVFHRSHGDAIQIMFSVHTSGSGVAGIFTKDIALTKVSMVEKLASENNFPLRCTVEPVK